MPGVTLTSLVDEALTFHHDGNLLGFCLDNPDEPFKDSFEDRCHDKLVGRWIDSREGYCHPQDRADGDEADEGEVADEEGSEGSYLFDDERLDRERQEDAGDFLYYQDGLSSEERELVRRVSLMTDHRGFSNLATEEDEGINFGHMSSPKGELNISRRNLGWSQERRDNRRRGPRTARTQHPKSYGVSGNSHCVKYGRQNYRHQLPRHEANDERRIAQYEALMEAQFARWEAERECDLEPLPVVHMSVRQQMLIPLWELRGSDITMQDVAELGDYLDEQRRIMDDMLLLFHGSYEWRDTVPEFTQEDVRNGRNRRWSEPVRRRRVGAFDRYDDYTDVGCSCDICLMGGYNNDDYWASDIGDVRFDEDIDVRDEWPSWYEMMWDLHDEDESEQREIFRAESVPLQCSSQRVTSTHRKLSGRDMMALF